MAKKLPPVSIRSKPAKKLTAKKTKASVKVVVVKKKVVKAKPKRVAVPAKKFVATVTVTPVKKPTASSVKVALPTRASVRLVEFECVCVFDLIRAVRTAMVAFGHTKVEAEAFAVECNNSHSYSEARVIAERFVDIV